jgi:hypothetical protein
VEVIQKTVNFVATVGLMSIATGVNKVILKHNSGLLLKIVAFIGYRLFT